jgi:glycosyltransferase involved in cell wall biosynthesis
MALVSVIIPAHNAALTIESCLDSVFTQLYKDLEIIVVEDSSTDETASILQRLRDPRLRIVSVSCRSAAASRNRGLEEAKGEFIQFLDADDLLSKNKIQAQLNNLLQYDISTISNCPWAHFISDPGDAIWEPQIIDKDINPIDWLTMSWNGCGMSQTACWLAPKRLLDFAGKWNENLTHNPNDDGEYFCRVLLKAKRIVFSPETMVYYRKPLYSNVSSVSSETQAQSLLDSYILCEEHIFSVEVSGRTTQAVAQNYYRFIYSFCQKFPMQCERAWQRLHSLNSPIAKPLGPRTFQWLMSFLGFKNALLVRKFLSPYRSRR